LDLNLMQKIQEFGKIGLAAKGDEARVSPNLNAMPCSLAGEGPA